MVVQASHAVTLSNARATLESTHNAFACMSAQSLTPHIPGADRISRAPLCAGNKPKSGPVFIMCPNVQACRPPYATDTSSERKDIK
ncbi:hypothetical protein ACQRIT_005259 [Beauveria bassiana]